MIGQILAGFFIVAAGTGTILAGILVISNEIKEERDNFASRLDYYGRSKERTPSQPWSLPRYPDYMILNGEWHATINE